MRRELRINESQVLFAVAGERGGVHFHVDPARLDRCGIEQHRRIEKGERCWLLDAPCEHDGSTLAARETWLPVYVSCNSTGDFEPLYEALEAYCVKCFA